MVLSIIMIFLMCYMAYLRVDLDETVEGDLLLWYGRKNRKYFVIWKSKN